MKEKILNSLMNKYKVQAIGNGYLDCVVVENVSSFIHELTNVKIKVTNISFWCHCTEKHKHTYNCPHGMGGPKSKYYDGWFSEMCHIPLIEVTSNELALDYIENKMRFESFYSPCLVPGLWLDLD